MKKGFRLSSTFVNVFSTIGLGKSFTGNRFDYILSCFTHAHFSHVRYFIQIIMYIIMFTVHLGGGMWGLLAAPLLNKNDGILYVGDKLSFKLLGWNILGGVVIIAWSALFSSLLFLSLKFFKKLKVTPEVEAKGNLKKRMFFNDFYVE